MKNPVDASEFDLESSCTESLEEGCGSRHYCDTCDQFVWDTSQMTRTQYEDLPATACVIATFEDGEMVFAPEPRLRSRFAALAAASLLALPLAACDSPPTPSAVSAVQTAATQPVSPNRTRPAENGSVSLEELLKTLSEQPNPIEVPDDQKRAEERFGQRMEDEFGLSVDDATSPTSREILESHASDGTAGESRGATVVPEVSEVELLQTKRNIRERRKKKPVLFIGIIRGDQ